MADYLNPDSMMTPYNTDKSDYRPGLSDMIMSDLKRQMQADEINRQTNFMNDQTRQLAPFLNAAAMEKAKRAALEDNALSSPDVLKALAAGSIGDNQVKQASGNVALSTMDSEIGTKKAGNQYASETFGLQNQYNRVNKLLTDVKAISMMPGTKEQKMDNIRRAIMSSMASNNIDWLNNDNYSGMQQILQSHPEAILNALESIRTGYQTQPDMMKLLEIAEKGRWANEEARIAASGKATTSAQDKKYTTDQNNMIKLSDQYNKIIQKMNFGIQVGYNPDGSPKIVLANDDQKKELRKRLEELAKQHNYIASQYGAPPLNPMDDIAPSSPTPGKKLSDEERAARIKQLQGQ